MVDIQPFVLVLVVAAIVAVATKYVRLPYTIALVLAGLAIGFTGLGSVMAVLAIAAGALMILGR